MGFEIYIIILLLTALAAALSFCRDCSKWRFLYAVMVFVALALVLGTRTVSVGTDTMAYATEFQNIKIYGLDFLASSHNELLFFMFMWFVGLFTWDSQVFFFIESIITVFFILRFIYKHSSNFALSVVLFQITSFYISAFNISRAWLAISIALIGFDYAKQHRLIPALAIVGIASLIHTSMLVFGLIYVAYVIIGRYQAHTVTLSALLGFAVCCLMGILLVVITSVVERYSSYVTYDNGSSIGIVPTCSLLVVICAVIAKEAVSHPDSVRDKDLYFYFCIIAIGSMISLSTSLGLFSLGGRFAQMFNVFILLLIPEMVKKIRGGYVWGIALMLLLSGNYIFQLMQGSSGVVPYSSWLF